MHDTGWRLGILQRDELATTGQQDWIVEGEIGGKRKLARDQ
jgi:hypothetical protein